DERETIYRSDRPAEFARDTAALVAAVVQCAAARSLAPYEAPPRGRAAASPRWPAAHATTRAGGRGAGDEF
ncbi:hypothetical protein ACFQ7N_40660, partial [Streptomyces niveus]|uniref:hypothetical protein n=1 Tax=Streptomyces niveus TaxID=193462 RepID=UPI003699ACAC